MSITSCTPPLCYQAQVKALREVEKLKDQLKESQSRLSALQEKFTTTDAARETAQATGNTQ